jgi:hypothetical protein
MATLTVPTKFNNMTEADYDDYVCFLAANCCEECSTVSDLVRNHESNQWVCSECNAAISAAYELRAEAAELAELTAAAGREFMQGDGCQNCGASGRLFDMGDAAAPFLVCDDCAGEIAAAPAIARKAPARARRFAEVA